MIYPPAFGKANGPRRPANVASDATERKLVMMFELLTQRRIRFSSYEENFNRDFRSFQRDLQQLRTIGKTNGFELSTIKDRQYVDLLSLDARNTSLNRDSGHLEALLATIAEALGEPILRQFGSRVGADVGRDDFFSFVGPKLIEGTTVADTCATLREAYSSPMGRAKVTFSYPDTGGNSTTVREVEPYGVIVRSGLFYLLGYDCTRRDWRLFAIDRFASNPVKAGTCLTKRTIPERYISEDFIGFFQGTKRIDVTIELAARVASSVIARQWQAGQRVERLADGRAQITLTVSDIGEVVRWTLGYGADARVIAPLEAVTFAAKLCENIAAAYRSATDA
jgi:predicted DNA-binding transcriptional regulator YafY